MTRRAITFDCNGAALLGTVDEAPGQTGLLIVSGGNEIRGGAWGGQAQLAARIAAAGHPVLRFDRRGVGDSEGANGGFRSSGPDIAAAIAAFRAQAPGLERIVAFGTCDAASALALGGAAFDLAALVLANPWTYDETGVAGESGETADQVAAVMPAAAIRARYLRKLGDPREWWRLACGGVDLAKLARGLRRAARKSSRTALAAEMESALARFAGPASIVLAAGDRTAQAFLANWNPRDPRIAAIDSASHSFSDDAARDFLFAQLIRALV